jgi:hypothetical protein
MEPKPVPSLPKEPAPLNPKPPVERKADRPVPEELDPDVSIDFLGKTLTSKGSRPTEKIRAAHALAEFGPRAARACRSLCLAMLDDDIKVRQAAADALRKVDPALSKLALAVRINQDVQAIIEIGQQKKRAAWPLVIWFINEKYNQDVLENARGGRPRFASERRDAVVTLIAIAPEEERTSDALIRLLKADATEVQLTILALLPDVKHKKKATSTVVKLLDVPSLTNKCVQVLPELADESTRSTIIKRLQEFRFAIDPMIRDAVDKALHELGDQ